MTVAARHGRPSAARRKLAAAPFGGQGLVALLLTGVAIWGARTYHGGGVGWSAPAIVLLTVPLAWRRRTPVVAFAVQIVGVLIVHNLDVLGFADLPVFGAILLGAYSVGAHARRRWPAAVVLLTVCVTAAVMFPDSMPHVPGRAAPFLLILPMALIGESSRRRREQLAAAESRASRLQAEREAVAAVAVAEERSRIARELHDVVSHNVSVMVIQAGALRAALTEAPTDIAAAVTAIETSGRETMAELRQFLGLLWTTEDGGDATPLAPQPGTAQLPVLLDRIRTIGQPVTLHTTGTTRPLPHSVDRAVYRVVQEALTNVLRHANGATATVTLSYTPREIAVEVIDDGTGTPTAEPGAGRGLLGLGERLSLHGGTLATGHRPGGGFRVLATLPAEQP